MVDDLVVHSTATFWVRMAEKNRVRSVRPTGVQDGFEAAGRTA
jgi:hypothetical protein